MLSSNRINAIVTASLTLVIAVSAAACNADNCLRALRATNTPGRSVQASADCSSFWATTITPSTKVYTTTATVSETIISTTYSYVTDLVHQTASTNVLSTVQVSLSGTTTVVAPVPINSSAPTLKKRVAATSGIPTYASWCSGAARFTSACSCIGVTAQRTVTAPTPSRAITVTETASFSVIKTIVQSVTTVIMDATSTEIVIATTQTVGAISTVRFSKFLIQITYPTKPTAAPDFGSYLIIGGGNQLLASSNQASARQYSLDVNGGLTYSYTNDWMQSLRYYMYTIHPPGASGVKYLFIQQNKFVLPENGLVTCTVGSSYKLSCIDNYDGSPLLLASDSGIISYVNNQTVFALKPNIVPVELYMIPQ
ncbi:hypothetical protein TWF694_002974 [Orbilia ellipsospora]|uniref:Membrane-associated protein n=1 Tax=Orbilia ellipsospora TaxID=2528407 RepID=A0AAV9X2S6_9PEZI